VLGIIISIGLPILRAMLPKAPTITRQDLRSEFWSAAQPYVIVLAFSTLAAFIVMAYLGNSVSDIEWFTAIIYGFTWDSIIQKTIGQETLHGLAQRSRHL
jgi:hypothetical protein